MASTNDAGSSMIRFLAITLLAACLPAYGAPVTVVVVGQQNQYADIGGLLPFPENDGYAQWVLTFSYESETPDSNPDANVGEYRDAISSISLTIGDMTFPSLGGTGVVMQNDSDNSSGGFTDLWLAVTFDDATLRSHFGVMLLNFSGTALTSDALVAPSWPFPPWGFGLIEYSIQDRSSPDPGNWQIIATANAQVTTVTVVPIPPTFWLLGTACVGSVGWLRRKHAA